MSTPKVGDRVRVEFEGDITGKSIVAVEVTRDSGQSLVLFSSDCTVIAPPAKVGDTVTPVNVGQLPVDTIVARDTFQPVTKVGANSWQGVGGSLRCYTDAQICDVMPEPGPRSVILRLGGAA